MSKQIEIPLASNTAEGDITGGEELINVYPRRSTGSKYTFSLINTPGLAYYCELPTFPVLALHQFGGKLYAITPSNLYEVRANGTYKDLGSLYLHDGIVSTEDNGTQLVMVDGVNGYYYDIDTEKLLQLKGGGWYPAKTVAYQDGYFIFERAGTGQFFISDLISVNFDPLNFASAEGQPDKLLRVLSDHRELILFGSESTEFWYNSGASDFPFERNQGAFIEKGIAAPYTAAKQDNTVYFVGSDLIVYSLSGYSPVRISNHAVEETLKNVDLSDSFAYTMQDEGHLFYVLTIPSRKITWRFDVSTGSWHKMADYHFGRHRACCSVFSDGKTLVGDFQSGMVFHLTRDAHTDNGEIIVRDFTLPDITKGREFFSIFSFELDMTAGIAPSNGQGSDPIALLYFSKDGGKTWSNVKEARMGKIGEYFRRIKWNRLGMARRFSIRVTISEPVPVDIGAAFIEIS